MKIFNSPEIEALNGALVSLSRAIVQAYESGNEAQAVAYAERLASVLRRLNCIPDYKAIMATWARAHGLGTWEGV